MLNASDWSKNPCGIIPVSTVENIPPTLVACYFFKTQTQLCEISCSRLTVGAFWGNDPENVPGLGQFDA